jgi:hypothetical protein
VQWEKGKIERKREREREREIGKGCVVLDAMNECFDDAA